MQRTPVSDLSPLASAPTLASLSLYATKVTAAGVAALQKAVPNCKVEWDKPIATFTEPAFQQWIKGVAALSADKQLDAVAKKLQELNPGFDGKLTGITGKPTPRIEKGVVTEVGLLTENVTDISPVRALVGLKALKCHGGGQGANKFFDLSPLNGLPLTWLDCSNTQVFDLSPLQGMQLTLLSCARTHVTDLSPLRGLPLTKLYMGHTRIADLSPLQGMNLTLLNCHATAISDLSALQGMPLGDIGLTPKNITKGMDVLRQMKNLKVNGTGGSADTDRLPADEFWKRYDAGEFGAPPAKLDFPDIKTPRELAEWTLRVGGKVNAGSGGDFQTATAEEIAAKDLSLWAVRYDRLKAIDDDAIAHMVRWPLPSLIGLQKTGITDAGLRQLAALKHRSMHLALEYTNVTGTGFDALAGRTFNVLSVGHCPISREGWARIGELKLTGQFYATACNLTDDLLIALIGRQPNLLRLYVHNNPLTDAPLEPISRLPQLRTLQINHTGVTDAGLAYLETTKTLVDLNVLRTKVTAAGVAKLQKALPNCKIEWDDSAKPAAPEMPIAALADPAFIQWTKDVAALPAEKQVEAVVKKLQELNPGFDGEVTPKIEKGVVTEIKFLSDNVTDISPVRALAGLRVLSCVGSAVGSSKLSDLSPLQGMPLTKLMCSNTPISDLSPLRGMKLTHLYCTFTQVSDLSPLSGMPLGTLWCYGTPVSDLSPLQGMNLTDFALTPKTSPRVWTPSAR